METREEYEQQLINTIQSTTEEDVQIDDVYIRKSKSTKKEKEKWDKDKATETNNKKALPDDFDCIVSIPSIALNKIVYTGKNRILHLEKYELITSAEDMRYQNGGNYIICGHASRVYGHSLNRLRELKIGDEVVIWYDNQYEQYIVSSVTYEGMNTTSGYCQQTKYRQITILSCAKYIAKDVYIVIKCTQLKKN